MAEENVETGAEVKEDDPFAGFSTEGYKEGERTEAEPAADDAEEDADEDADSGDGDDSSSEEDESAESDESEKPVGEAPAARKKKSAKDRIDELTRLRYEAERRAESSERRLRDLEDKSVAKPAEKGTEPRADDSEEDGADGPPSPDTYTYGELDSKYIADLSRYHTDQRWSELETRQRQQVAQQQALDAQRAAQEKFRSKIENGAAKYRDFQTVVVEGAERGEWALSDTMGEMLVESDVGADIAYHLAVHPEEAAQVFRLAPMEQARYFGKLEAKFSAEQEAATRKSGKDPAPSKTPQAPTPVLPSRGAGGKFQPSAKSDFESFERVAMENK